MIVRTRRCWKHADHHSLGVHRSPPSSRSMLSSPRKFGVNPSKTPRKLGAHGSCTKRLLLTTFNFLSYFFTNVLDTFTRFSHFKLNFSNLTSSQTSSPLLVFSREGSFLRRRTFFLRYLSPFFYWLPQVKNRNCLAPGYSSYRIIMAGTSSRSSRLP
jgi:hypothetical protein